MVDDLCKFYDDDNVFNLDNLDGFSLYLTMLWSELVLGLYDWLDVVLIIKFLIYFSHR